VVISYFGGECFKITQGELTLAFNLPAKESKQKPIRFGSDIVLVSQNTPDYNGVENAAFGERQPFVIDGPGEYEVKGVAVRGYPGEGSTIYSVALEGMTLCFLGPLSSSVLPAGATQELDEVDILFVPVGGSGVLDHREAYKLAVQLGPKVVIPMHYAQETLKSFLKEAGAEGLPPQEKFTVKKKDLDGKEGEVVVLQA